MKKTITSLLLSTVFCVASLVAQIPNDSPIPVDIKFSGTDGFYSVIPAGDYLTTSGFGDTLLQTVSGPLAWAYGKDSLGNQTDTLLCTPAFNDLTGKIALIRRGGCFFSSKIFFAQEAGAIGVVILNNAPGDIASSGMGAGNDTSLLDHIPAIWITLEEGATLVQRIDSGKDVTATFEVKSFGTPLHAYSYSTPLSGVVPLEDVGVTYINTGADMQPAVTVTAEIKDPGGNTATLTKVLADVPAFSVNPVTFDDSYLPTAVGEYNVHYSNSWTNDTFDKKFEVTEFTYAQDNNNIIENTNGTIEPSDAQFQDPFKFTYDFGNFYRTGSQAQVATHVTFILGNPLEIWTGDPAADVFKIRIYDADPDGNGQVPSAAGTSYDILDEGGGTVDPAGQADYILTGSEADFERLTVELDEPLTLDPNKIYLVMVQYNGLAAGIGIPPKYAIAGSDAIAGGLGSVVFGDSLYTDGWSSGVKAVVRLHLDGFTTGTDEVLDNSKISIAPNPVSDVLRLQLSLEKNADRVDAHILDFTGRLVKSHQFENVKEGTLSLNVRDLANGTYFLSVKTPEGYRAKKFVVMR